MLLLPLMVCVSVGATQPSIRTRKQINQPLHLPYLPLVAFAHGPEEKNAAKHGYICPSQIKSQQLMLQGKALIRLLAIQIHPTLNLHHEVVVGSSYTTHPSPS